MNRKIILILLLIGLIGSCKKQNPCDDLVNGVYQFPELPEDHSHMSSQDVTEFWDLPENICNCISTEGLIETVMNYPDLKLIMAGSSPQSGYANLVRHRFRGSRELETRPDRATYLLKKYKTIDPVGYDSNWEGIDIAGYIIHNIWFYQIILSQYRNLEAFTENQEKIKLIETAIVIYDKSKEDIEEQSLMSLECVTTLLGRLMYINNYPPFVEAYNDNWFVRELIDFYSPVNPETVEFVYNLSKEYLQNLKNK